MLQYPSSMEIPAIQDLLTSSTVQRARTNAADQLREIPPHAFYYAADEIDLQMVQECEGEHIYPRLLPNERGADIGRIALEVKTRIDLETGHVLSFYEKNNMAAGTMFGVFPIIHQHTTRCMNQLPVVEQAALIQLAFARRHQRLLCEVHMRDCRDKPTKNLERRLAYLEDRYERLIEGFCTTLRKQPVG